MTSHLITEGRVVRDRRPEPGQRKPKARWLVHRDDCVFAPGCTPLADLVEQVGESGVLMRLRRGLVARCVSCRPIMVEFLTRER